MSPNNPTKFLSSSIIDYELIDLGHKRKLERFGNIVLNRPEIEAHGKPFSDKNTWNTADWFFYEEKGKKGSWTNNKGAKDNWSIQYQFEELSLSFQLKLTGFKHIGIFPEQAENWKYIQQQLKQIRGEKRVLNLFAYTGAASIVAAASGAKVTNVDSVKQVLNWGKENAKKNNIDSIRWIHEDARKFVEKANRRGEKYHGIIMDPPAFGYGAKKETWKLERDLKDLLQQSVQLLDPTQHFLILNTYSPKLNIADLSKMVNTIKAFPKKYELVFLALKSNKKQILPLGNLLRFSK